MRSKEVRNLVLFIVVAAAAVFLFRLAPFHKATLRSELVLNEDGKVVASYRNDIMFFVFKTMRDDQEDITYFPVDEFAGNVPVGEFVFDKDLKEPYVEEVYQSLFLGLKGEEALLKARDDDAPKKVIIHCDPEQLFFENYIQK